MSMDTHICEYDAWGLYTWSLYTWSLYTWSLYTWGWK